MYSHCLLLQQALFPSIVFGSLNQEVYSSTVQYLDNEYHTVSRVGITNPCIDQVPTKQEVVATCSILLDS